jgi:D-3-phosphoglycerate dehydrogenase
LGIRSKTKVTKKVIAVAEKLMTVGAFCIGTKQIDLEACKENGIVVFNAPYSNTRSVVELAIGEIIMLMRSVFQRSTELHNGQWNKTAQGSKEVRGKKLGIVGYGNIGKQLSILAEALGMHVFYYDIEDKLALGNATKVTDLSELLAISDVVTLHIDDNAANKNFFGKKEISQMKEGAVFVNLSRGFVVDILALKDALLSGKISGAAVDVYPEEPAKNGEFKTELKGLNNVILTPHVGGSTEEAQKDIADFVPNKMMAYINLGNTVDAVNFPNIRLPRQTKAHRFLHIHKNVPGVMAEINKVLAKFDMNITGQYLSTDDKVGYVISDLDKEYNQDVLNKLRAVEGTIKFRVLY